MRLEEHCKRTRQLIGAEYEDIHKYLDRNFDHYCFMKHSMMTSGDWYPGEKRFDPFSHRKLEHHKEGIEKVLEHFLGIYPFDDIKRVCEQHIRDDYDGYIPSESDFDNPDFIKKYHR
jgi:CBS domain-containing protein